MSFEQPKKYSEEEIRRMAEEQERSERVWMESMGMEKDEEGWEELTAFLDTIGVRVEVPHTSVSGREGYIECKFYPIPGKGINKEEQPVLISMFENSGASDEEHGEEKLNSNEEWQWRKIGLSLKGLPDVSATLSANAPQTESKYHTGFIVRQGTEERRFVLLRSIRRPRTSAEPAQ